MKASFNKGMPFEKLERMKFEETSEEDEEEATNSGKDSMSVSKSTSTLFLGGCCEAASTAYAWIIESFTPSL